MKSVSLILSSICATYRAMPQYVYDYDYAGAADGKYQMVQDAEVQLTDPYFTGTVLNTKMTTEALTLCEDDHSKDSNVKCQDDGKYQMVQDAKTCVDELTGEKMVGYVPKDATTCWTICQRMKTKWSRFTFKNMVQLQDDTGKIIEKNMGSWIPQCDDQTGHFNAKQDFGFGSLCMKDIHFGKEDHTTYVPNLKISLKTPFAHNCDEIAATYQNSQ